VGGPGITPVIMKDGISLFCLPGILVNPIGGGRKKLMFLYSPAKPKFQEALRYQALRFELGQNSKSATFVSVLA